MASNAELNNSIIQLTRDVNDLTDAVNVKKQVLDTAVDEAEASETAAAASAAAAANSQTSASASAGAAAQSAADAAEVVTGGEGSLEPLPGKLPIADSRGKILPGWLERLAFFLPITHALEVLRHVLIGGASIGEMGAPLLTLAGFAVVLVPAAWLCVSWGLDRAKVVGGLAEY